MSDLVERLREFAYTLDRKRSADAVDDAMSEAATEIEALRRRVTELEAESAVVGENLEISRPPSEQPKAPFMCASFTDHSEDPPFTVTGTLDLIDGVFSYSGEMDKSVFVAIITEDFYRGRGQRR